MPTALVTGPTAGIGRGFAEAFARKGFDLVLVSRDEARLTALGEELLAAYGVSSEVMAADLSERADVDRVAARLGDTSAPIHALVNNAGFTLNSSFLRDGVDDEQRLLDVLVTAVMRLSHAALPGMVERGGGMLINVASTAAWFPGGTYSAAKSWALVFSESLALELQGTGVRAIAVCPGFVHTEFHQRARVDMSSLPEYLWLDVPQVVDQAFKDLARGKSVSVAGAQYKAVSTALRHGPRSIGRVMTMMRSRNEGLGKRR